MHMTHRSGDAAVDPQVAPVGAAPALTARLVAYAAVLGTLADHGWARTELTDAERDQVVAFCLAAAGSPAGSRD